jgi:hypothetical protein
MLSRCVVGVMASNEDILQRAIIGIPHVAEKIVKLSDEQRQKAYEVVEQSYLQTVIGSDYAEGDARYFVDVVMDTLRAEVTDRVRNEAGGGHDNFVSLERVMKLLVNTASVAD